MSPTPKFQQWRGARSPEPKRSVHGQDSTPQPRHFNTTYTSALSPTSTSTRRSIPPPMPRDSSDAGTNQRPKTSSTSEPIKATSAPCIGSFIGSQAAKASVALTGGSEIAKTPFAPAVSGSRSLASSRSLTPTGMRKLSGAEEPVRILGVGSGGILELSQQVNDCMVSWALLRFQVGGGTFLRTKYVAIHCNGEDTPVMLRGWLNGRSSEVLSLLGEVHANIDITRAKDLTVQDICKRLLPLFAADNLVLSLSALHEEYGKVVQQLQEESRQRTLASVPAPAPPKPEVRITPRTASEALRAVGAERGPCNWVLLEPRSLQLHSCGLGGIEDLKSSLAEDRVLFGALRLSFGRSPGIVKHIFVHWVGPRVSAVQRGLLNARLADATTMVGKCCAVVFRREAHCIGDLRLEDIIMELRRLTVVDGIAATDGIAAGRISAAEYLAALKEETSIKQPEAEPETPPSPPPPPVPAHVGIAVKTAIDKVRSTSGEWNWVLCGWDRPEPLHRSAPSRGGA